MPAAAGSPRGAGYATEPYAEFLRRLDARMGSGGGGALASLARTHPRPADRLKELEGRRLILADGQTLADRFARLGR